MRPLTKMEIQVLIFVAGFYKYYGELPKGAEIARAFGFKRQSGLRYLSKFTEHGILFHKATGIYQLNEKMPAPAKKVWNETSSDAFVKEYIV